MESPSQILEFLDRSFNSIEMPCLGNMNIDYISSRLLAFRDDTRWLILFNSIVWWAAGQGLTTIVSPIGNCVKGKQGFDNTLRHQFRGQSNRCACPFRPLATANPFRQHIKTT